MFVVSEWPVLRGPAGGADPGQLSGFLEGVGASFDSSFSCGSSPSSPSLFELLAFHWPAVLSSLARPGAVLFPSYLIPLTLLYDTGLTSPVSFHLKEKRCECEMLDLNLPIYSPITPLGVFVTPICTTLWLY